MPKASNMDDDAKYYQFDQEATVRVSLFVQRRIFKDRDYVTGIVDIDGEISKVRHDQSHFFFYTVIKDLKYFLKTGKMKESRFNSYDVTFLGIGKQYELCISPNIDMLTILEFSTKKIEYSRKVTYWPDEQVAYYAARLSDIQLLK